MLQRCAGKLPPTITSQFTNFTVRAHLSSFRSSSYLRFSLTMSGIKQDPYLAGSSDYKVSIPSTNGKPNGNINTDQLNAWQHPGPAAYDFRSDTITTPTVPMLNAIINTTLGDDVFNDDKETTDLEESLAKLTGHEAGLLVMSGTMGNQVAVRSHLTQPPYSILCDIRCHLNNYEGGAASSMTGAMLIPIHPSNGHHLTLDDIKKHVIISDDIHACPTQLISLENTLNGMIMPVSEIEAISAFAKEHDIRLHLDGARIWECVAAGQPKSIDEMSRLFDSVTMCFSKGLGAPIGSLLVGNKAFIKQARRIRKMMGGGTRQSGIIAAAARAAVEDVFGKGPTGEGSKLKAQHEVAEKIAKKWTDMGGKLTHPVETNMVWLDLDGAGVSSDEWLRVAVEEGIKSRPGRLVIHYQICQDALVRLDNVMDKVMASSKKSTNGA